MHLTETARFLIIAGVAIAAVGFLLLISDRLPLGRLPGDLKFGSGNFRIYIPVVTCVLLSVLITLVVNFFSRR